MVSEIKQEENSYVLRFGGGIHSRPPEDEIDIRECATGRNFTLDVRDHDFHPRPPFDNVGTTPNAGAIRGMGQLVKQNGDTSFLVQSAGNIYEWDGIGTFTLAGTCDASAMLRGWRWHNFTLDDVLVLTDLNGVNPVLTWNGKTLQEMPHNLPGDFFARYCFVRDERAWYANVRNFVAVPHMIVGSKRSDYKTISISDRPSTSLSDEDPFFFLTPDLRAVNGLVGALGTVVVSSLGPDGNLYNISGQSAQDYTIDDFYAGSGALGVEGLAYVGNDILYGRQGRIESLVSTDRFGDVESDDLSLAIGDTVAGFKRWRIVYNSRLDRVYCEAVGESQTWVLHKGMVGGPLSPWSKWTTAHALAFNPVCMMNLLDPVTGLEYVWMGDTSGNLYRLEGTGLSGDAGSENVVAERVSGLMSAPLDSEAYEIEGWVKYRKADYASTLTLTFEFAGQTLFDQELTITLPAGTGGVYFGGGSSQAYFGGSFYFGLPFGGRVTRKRFPVPGQGNEFQIRTRVEGTADFRINEIGVRFKAA